MPINNQAYKNLILKIAHTFEVSHFVETGTYLAETAVWASQFFESVISIERSSELYETARSKYGHIENLRFINADSRDGLSQYIKQFKSFNRHIRVLFWLDAHWSGGLTYGQKEECPLLDEIRILNFSAPDNIFILIDNARLFLESPPLPHQITQWPTIDKVITSLKAMQNDRYIFIHEDIIVSVPEFTKQELSCYCQHINTEKQKNIQNPNPLNINSRTTLPNEQSKQLQESGELSIIQSFIRQGDTVFDVGANVGSWSASVLSQHSCISLHLFEPSLTTYTYLLRNLQQKSYDSHIIPNNIALSHSEDSKNFFSYSRHNAWNTLHRRLSIEEELNIEVPKVSSVSTTTIDRYVDQLQIPRVNFIKIDTEGSKLEILQGATILLSLGRVDYIQFEYGGTYVDANSSLEKVYNFLTSFNYAIFKIHPDHLSYLPYFELSYENFEYSNFLAVNERLTPTLLGHSPQMLNLPMLCKSHNITPRGVIHVGAHEGKELSTYKAMKLEKIVFIEANPSVFKRLQNNLQNENNVIAVECAISDLESEEILHITSMDQSSSILSLKNHKVYYPDIYEVQQIQVNTKRLDTLILEELDLKPSGLNLLNIDVQGAELKVLRGATQLLPYIDGINTEVNYEELYEGCALINQIDDFLEKFGFKRVAAISPFHHSWGDAFYIKKPVVTMSTLGENGRFANQLFQYAFLKIYAQEHNLQIQVPQWVGQSIFGFNDSPVDQELPLVKDKSNNLDSAIIPNSELPYENVDLWGYFQYHTSYYASHQQYWISLFSEPVAEIRKTVEFALSKLQAYGKTIVGIHLRRGDYGYEYFFIAPTYWYLEWLEGYWETLEDPVLFIASDEPQKVIYDFWQYSPVTIHDLNTDTSYLGFNLDFYIDFYLLSHCDILAISNSSFSFASAMLNMQAKSFFRPQLSTKKLIPFDPWNSEVLLREDKVEDKFKTQLYQQLSLRELNYIILPDWSKTLNNLDEEIDLALRFLVSLPKQDSITLLICLEGSHIDQMEDIQAWIFEKLMLIMISESLDFEDGLQISYVTTLKPFEWQVLCSCISGRIPIVSENIDFLERIKVLDRGSRLKTILKVD